MCSFLENYAIPSGKHTKNYGKIHHFIAGKIHYFDWAIFNSYFDITRPGIGKKHVPKHQPDIAGQSGHPGTIEALGHLRWAPWAAGRANPLGHEPWAIATAAFSVSKK